MQIRRLLLWLSLLLFLAPVDLLQAVTLKRYNTNTGHPPASDQLSVNFKAIVSSCGVPNQIFRVYARNRRQPSAGGTWATWTAWGQLATITTNAQGTGSYEATFLYTHGNLNLEYEYELRDAAGQVKSFGMYQVFSDPTPKLVPQPADDHAQKYAQGFLLSGSLNGESYRLNVIVPGEHCNSTRFLTVLIAVPGVTTQAQRIAVPPIAPGQTSINQVSHIQCGGAEPVWVVSFGNTMLDSGVFGEDHSAETTVTLPCMVEPDPEEPEEEPDPPPPEKPPTEPDPETPPSGQQPNPPAQGPTGQGPTKPGKGNNPYGGTGTGPVNPGDPIDGGLGELATPAFEEFDEAQYYAKVDAMIGKVEGLGNSIDARMRELTAFNPPGVGKLYKLPAGRFFGRYFELDATVFGQLPNIVRGMFLGALIVTFVFASVRAVQRCL